MLVCICMNGPSADAYKIMQYAKMKAVPVPKGFGMRGWKGCKPMLSVPGAVHDVAGDFNDLVFSPLVFFFFLHLTRIPQH